MIKKYVLLFFFAFILLKTETFAMATETEEPGSRYAPVFRQVVRLYEFLSEPQDDIPDFQKESLEADLTLATNFLGCGEKLLNGKITGDFFFQKVLLKTRLEYLLQRTNLAKTLSCVPSDSNFLKDMQKYRKEFADEGNEYAIARNLQRYQFLNLLCSSMFKILRRDELSEETVKLLRASPKLWSLLKSETHDLGHPDEAGGYAIVQAYLEQFKGVYESRNSFTPPTNAALDIRNKVECPLWEKEKLRNDAALYEAHFKKKTSFIPFKGLGCPKTRGVYLELTPFESRLWEKDLPYPAFLQPTTYSTEIEEVTFPQEPSFFDIFPFEKLDDEEKISEEDTSSQASSSTEASSSTGASSSTDFIMPSGIRKFHDLIPSSPYVERGVNKNDQKFINKIFDVKGFKKITYGDFEAFWIKQDGKIVASHGGSHRLLVGPKGDSLTGTYTHGRGQTYTPKTIKYLRAALWYIGCRPSN